MKKKLTNMFVFLIILSLIFTLSGCSASNSSNSNKEPSSSQSQNQATNYPTKPIQVYVGYAAGGATDIATRMMAPYLEKQLGQPIVVINKPGSGAEIAYVATAKANSDGYTLGVINSPTVLAIPLSRKAQYKLSDFAIIGNLAFDENVIIIKPNGKYKDLEDLVQKAKENPDTITMGVAGLYADDHLAGLALQQAAGVKFRYPVFQGGAQLSAAVMGGQIDAALCNGADVMSIVQEGKLVVAATMGNEENPNLPGAPTLKSKGYDIVMGSYRALVVPANTPPEILDKLRAALKKAAEDPDYIAKNEKTKQPILYLSPEDFSKVLKTDEEKLGKLWKTLGLPSKK